MLKKAIVSTYIRPDRLVTVKLLNSPYVSGNICWQIIDGKLAGATFNPVDYHNANRAYWIRFT
jgi:hypothetical protein